MLIMRGVSALIGQASEEAGPAVGLLADLPAPKIRLGRFAVGPVHWRTGDQLRVTLTDVTDTHDPCRRRRRAWLLRRAKVMVVGR